MSEYAMKQLQVDALREIADELKAIRVCLQAWLDTQGIVLTEDEPQTQKI